MPPPSPQTPLPGVSPTSRVSQDRTATQTHVGYGHGFAARHYIDAWLEVTGVTDWSPGEIAKLKRQFDLP